jgi:PAS domain S-box-containing protein
MTVTTFGTDIDLTRDSVVRAALANSDRACVINRAEAPYDILAVNDAWTRLCGYSAEQALHRTPKQLLHGEYTDTRKSSEFTQNLIAHEHAKVTLINHNGSCRPFIHKIESRLLTDEATAERFYVTESCEERDPAIVRALRARARFDHSIRDEDLVTGLVVASVMALVASLVYTWLQAPNGEMPGLGLLVLHDL